MLAFHIDGLHKRYPKFHLDDVSFSLEQGFIMGFIGINGAGKTTTLKSMLNLSRPDSGSVEILGKDPFHQDDELALKQELGVVLGDKDLYKQYRIGKTTDVVSRFYREWDQEVYDRYCREFDLDQEKKLGELSEGMRTKYFLTLALSHNAKLLILDEPTSGLDPAARDDLLEIFQELVEDGEKSILYSTHITSDLEKCADYITYIHDGRIIGSDTRVDFVGGYRMVQGDKDQLTDELADRMISCRNHSYGFTGLIRSDQEDAFSAFQLETPSIEDIMIYYAKRRREDEKPVA